jgi:hypothetical protein
LLSGAFRNRFGRGLACRLAVLDRLSRGALGRLGDLALGIFFVRRSDRASSAAVTVPTGLPSRSIRVEPALSVSK